MTSISGTTETVTTQADDTTGTTGGNGDDEIARRVRAFLVDTFLLGDDDGFADDESLLEQGIVDSTGVMELVAFLEEAFAIAVEDDELVAANLDSVERMAAFVDRKR